MNQPIQQSNLTEVSHFGLHRSPEGIAYLHQSNPQGHNFIGWKKPSPFIVKADRKARCPHSLPASIGHPDAGQWEMFIRLYEDPLFRAFLPIPKEFGEKVGYFGPGNQEDWMTMLILLSKLSSPVTPSVIPFGKITTQKLNEQLNITNLGPLVLTGVETGDQNAVVELVAEATLRPRKLLLVGDSFLVVRHPMERIESHLQRVQWHELLALPLEQLGAVALRRYCRAEQINTPMVKREAA